MPETKLFENVLVPIDDSASSMMAQEVAVMIAKKIGSRVTVFHVMQEFILGYGIAPEILDELEGSVLQHADKTVNNALALFNEEGVSASAETTRSSDPAESILKFAEKNIDLVVMGVHGENEKDQYTLGSVTRKVITHVKVPTFITKKRSLLSNMLVCVDGSEHSTRALEVAVRLAEKTGSRITLLNVQDQRLKKASSKAVEELADKIFSNASSAVEKRRVKLEKKLEIGVPSDRIVEVAERGKYDLIVLGKRGLGKIKRFLLGSISDDVIQKAKTSILIVPAET